VATCAGLSHGRKFVYGVRAAARALLLVHPVTGIMAVAALILYLVLWRRRVS
jgi:hypothetical protein